AEATFDDDINYSETKLVLPFKI
ncbi:hypothetical protein CCACVL1_30409, partial [Corchorus capsularis]